MRSKFTLLTLCVLLIFALCACGDGALDTAVIETRPGELVFSAGADDFVDRYNRLYERDNGGIYLTPSEEWDSVVRPSSIHSEHETVIRTFSADESVWSMPTITLYTPSDADRIQEITVDFDDHSYSDETWLQYEEMCFYTLKALFPDMDDESITALYSELNSLAIENVVQNEQGYDSDSVPCALYCRDGVGVYPYFAIGECMHLCIIPVDDGVTERYARLGTEVVEIDRKRG